MANQINLSFDNGTEGTVSNKNTEIGVSFTGQSFAPYELFLGGYASCLHATFKGIMAKRRLDFETVTYDVIGHKREEVPTILNKLETTVTISGTDPNKEKQIRKSMETAERYCSISATINQIGAEMILNMVFK
jgi:putative redox protein